MAKKTTKKKVSKKKTAVKKSKSPYGGMSITQLIAALGSATDPVEKRKIRAALRKNGHTGGLNKKPVKTKKKTSKKKTTKKKTSKKKTS